MLLQNRITIIRPDRDRLSAMLTGNGVTLPWAIFANELYRELARARVVEPDCIPEDVVTMHSTVRITDLATHRIEIYTLVYPAESDLPAGRLSVLAPLGTALLGASVGDIVQVNGSFGLRVLRVEEVIYQPEAEGVEQA